jgi:hypothetical protein
MSESQRLQFEGGKSFGREKSNQQSRPTESIKFRLNFLSKILCKRVINQIPMTIFGQWVCAQDSSSR